MKQEIWKDIEGYEGYYQVSNTGRVKALDREVKCKTGKLLKYKSLIFKPINNGKGYMKVVLSKKGASKSFYIHRLVCDAFLPKVEDKNHVNHINEIKSDNRVENLEWCNQHYNNNYGTANERMSITKSNELIRIDSSGIVEFFDSVRKAQEYGYSRSQLSKCLCGIRDSYKGSKWFYTERIGL